MTGHQDVFVGCLAIRRLPPRAGAAEGDAQVTLAPAALEHPSTSRCPALGADGRCTLHGDGKPATCAAVPLDPLAPDHRQHEVLAERLRGRAGEGACLVRGEREGRAVLDEWAAHDVGRVKVNLIETLVAQRNGRPALQCASSPFCGKNVAVEHDGRVYSCDHFVYPEHEIGRVGERSLAEIVLSPRQLEFGLAKRNALSPRCRECAHLALCWGDCPRTRFVRTRDGATVSYLCAGWRRFFEHGLPVVERLGLARPEV